MKSFSPYQPLFGKNRNKSSHPMKEVHLLGIINMVKSETISGNPK